MGFIYVFLHFRGAVLLVLVHQGHVHIVGKWHTEWCPAWAIRNIRDYIFHGTGGRIVQCSMRKCGMCPSRQGIIRALAAYSCTWGGCIRNMYTLWKMHTEWRPAWAIEDILYVL